MYLVSYVMESKDSYLLLWLYTLLTFSLTDKLRHSGGKNKQEVSKFINYCNETKAATLANKEGGQLSIVKTPANADNSNAKKE